MDTWVVARFVGHLANGDVTRKHAGQEENPPRVPMTPVDPVVKVFLERTPRSGWPCPEVAHMFQSKADFLHGDEVFSQKLATPPLHPSSLLGGIEIIIPSSVVFRFVSFRFRENSPASFSQSRRESAVSSPWSSVLAKKFREGTGGTVGDTAPSPLYVDRYWTVFEKRIFYREDHLPFGVVARAIFFPLFLQFFDTRLEGIFVKVNLGDEDIEHSFQVVFRWNLILEKDFDINF